MDTNLTLEETIFNVASGGAVAFLGAGFSFGATLPEYGNNKVPSSTDAKSIIAKEAGYLKSVDNISLSDISEILDYKYSNKIKYTNYMVDFFLKNFTKCIPSKEQKEFYNIPWRSIFTTNYDDILQSLDEKNIYDFFSPKSKNLNVNPGKIPVYYLHGRAEDLYNPNNLDGFVISETDYLEINKKNVELYNRFFSDIYTASEVVFIGYSLRDIEIASRLFSIRNISRKVSIITSKDADEMDLIRLKKFGTIYPVGLDGFIDKMNEIKPIMSVDERNYLSFLKKKEIFVSEREVEASDVEELFLTGVFDKNLYCRQMYGYEKDNDDFGDLYSVPNEKSIDEIFGKYISGFSNKFIIAADVGNGKTCFLAQVACHAAKYFDFDVYEVDTQINEVYLDIDKILSNGKKSIFIIDGFLRYKNIISYISSRLGSKNIIVVSDPETMDPFIGDKLHSVFSGPASLVNINNIDHEGISFWDKLLERWGLWGDKIQLTSDRRLRFLKENCGAENRSIVLSLFKNSKLSVRIDALVKRFVSNNTDYEEGLIAILIRALCHQHVEWHYLVSWLSLDVGDIRRRIESLNFRTLTNGAHGWYEITSPELASYILNNYEFNSDVIISTYCSIVVKTASASKDERNGYDFQQNLKELMRYRFLTRLFSQNPKQEEYINAVYQRLSKNPAIRSKELFWLQWGMARLDLNDLHNAETYLKTAKGLAEKYGKTHSVYQVDDQFARLYLKRSIQHGTDLSENEIREAVRVIADALQRKEEVLIHPMRSALLIEDMLNIRIDDLSTELLHLIRNLLEEMREIMENGDLERAQKGENRKIKSSILNSIILIKNY